MNRLLAVLLACAACHSSPTRDPVRVRASPLAVETCATIGAEKDGRRCAVYDTRAKAFAEQGDGTPEDALARRAFLYERWLDLYAAPEKQIVVRNMKTPMAPGDPESRFGDEQYLNYWDDQGDSAGFGDAALLSVIFHYAVTGTEADYQRFEAWVRGAVRQWDATGLDGYLARWHYAQVPAGTQIRNGYAMDYPNPQDAEIPARALARMPAYYQTGIDVGGQHVAVRPTWHGHTSIDAYAGPMNSWPLAFNLIRDPALKARMALHYGCFLKRLRIIKVINLSKNTQLQADVARYLTGALLKKDPDDPDLAKADQIWGFYLPQYNAKSAATYPQECPAQMATDALPEDVIDVSRVGFEGKLLSLVTRQADGSELPDSIDFGFYPSVRAGDAVMLESYALGAYHLTGDAQFLHWRDQVLIGKANGREVTRTVGAFLPPRPCRSYYRTPNVYTSHLMRTMIDGDASSREFAQMIFRRKFAGREMAGLRDALFEVFYSGVLAEKTPGLDDALADLKALGGAPGHLDDPRRNYATDLRSTPVPGVAVEKASAEELRICSQPVTLLGVTIPLDPPDAEALYANPAPPVMQRPPDNWIWEKDPFIAQRHPGDAGQQQYPGLDLIEPYWAARYFGLLPDTHLVLAWK